PLEALRQRRSEEPSPRDAYGTAGQSLTQTGGGGRSCAPFTYHLRPSQSAILPCVPVAKPSGTPLRMTVELVENFDAFWRFLCPLLHREAFFQRIDEFLVR